ncbi:hypothetical protein [uncultured Eubacterium sp.]|uniref:hypothetical protein n=1 Tax=uncultured Eubacterium sp. TaxID=165185 RepID=UPI002599A1F3|nr:hypothetical protein [uncultured Eubacterium sp.]
MSKINEEGQKIIEKALKYANYEWYATDKNIKHGIDSNGIEVDTPDTTWKGEKLDCGWWKPNHKNIGVPYAWGLGSTLEEFEKGIESGKYAGNVPEDKSRKISYECVGVDCSGLLTECWELAQKISTRVIPEYADEIERIEEIQQGDALAKLGSHVMLFKEFTDETKKVAIIIDATRSTGKVSVRQENVEELFAKGYKIYRKK